MVAFLFWNLARKPLQGSLASLAARHKVDVLMVAESVLPDKTVLAALNADNPGAFAAIPFVAFDRVKVYSRFAPSCFGAPYEADQYAIRGLQIPRGIEILLAVVHLSSPTWKKPADLHSRAIELGKAIRTVENEVHHDRTIVVGDFNMNPFHARPAEERTTMKSFWPDFAPVDQVGTPLDALQEQAALLPDKTGGLVEAVIATEVSGNLVWADLLLTSSREPGYRYQLLQVRYPLDHYPLTVVAGEETDEANDEPQYLEILKRALGSPRTRRIVEAIMAHVRSRPAAESVA
jgi:hypothetical protein